MRKQRDDFDNIMHKYRQKLNLIVIQLDVLENKKNKTSDVVKKIRYIRQMMDVTYQVRSIEKAYKREMARLGYDVNDESEPTKRLPLLHSAQQTNTYIISNEVTKSIKIGRSKNLMRRVNELENACGNGLVLFAYTRYDVEKKMHKDLADKRKNGEWFDCTPHHAISVGQKYASDWTITAEMR